jgi:hypothetical protein
MDKKSYNSLRKSIEFKISCIEEQIFVKEKELRIEYTNLNKLEDEWMKIKYPDPGDRDEAILKMYQ